MADDFWYDVFLSHSSKDKPVVRALAERLRADGVRVWFDEWAIEPGDSIPVKVDEGLDQSRVLVFFMSENAFGSDWVTLESQTFRFRDPLNKERRFVPIRLDRVAIKGSLSQFLYIDLNDDSEDAYKKLLQVCRVNISSKEEKERSITFEKSTIQLPLDNATVWICRFNEDGKMALIGGEVSNDNEERRKSILQLWNVEKKKKLRDFVGHSSSIYSLVWSNDMNFAISGSTDKDVRLWDVGTGKCLRIIKNVGVVRSIAWNEERGQALFGFFGGGVELWNVEAGEKVCGYGIHSEGVCSILWDTEKNLATSSSFDGEIKTWSVTDGNCIRNFYGHGGSVYDISIDYLGRNIISGSIDNTIRLWDIEKEECVRVFEGHTKPVFAVSINNDGSLFASGSEDKTLRLWDVKTGECIQIFKGHEERIYSLRWSSDGKYLLSADTGSGLALWEVSDRHEEILMSDDGIDDVSDYVQYTNAKVLLVGESGAGKTGLSKVLAGEQWHPSDSTVGAWATQWKLPVSSDDGIEKEIWLWDFGGQADQRLVHQLYMDETALAVLVFDGQKDDLFETLGQWNRDLSRASQKDFSKLLVAGRVDAGGLRGASLKRIEAFKTENGFDAFLETSAKSGVGCNELKHAILNGIDWKKIPWRSTPTLFKRLRTEIIRLKDEGRVLMRFNELREALQIRLSGQIAHFNDDELKTVVTLLAGPGAIWRLTFGNWVLLQPERINSYAQVVIQTLRSDEHERGCLLEKKVLDGELIFHKSVSRLDADDERIVLHAMNQILVERGLCIREDTEDGALLTFPSYYRRERPELVGHPAVLISYRFNGFLDEIYATLVVRLHYTKPFKQDELWRYAADFRTLTGKQLGVKLTRLAEGSGELEVYFEPAVSAEEKIIFSKYVHEHLLRNAKDVLRLRHYVCPHCGTPAGNPDVAMRKLLEGKQDIPCINCDDASKRIPLWDKLEEMFASPEIKQKVRELQQQSNIELDNESKERTLVGEVISTVALAGQLSREFSVSDHGIDMELEFKSDSGDATGKKLYLQLKSGDTYLRQRKGDGAEVFAIKERHVDYWMSQAFPVMLVIRNSKGEVRWMEVREWLKRESGNGNKPVTQIVFEGERFDVMAVRRWRDKVLSQA